MNSLRAILYKIGQLVFLLISLGAGLFLVGLAVVGSDVSLPILAAGLVCFAFALIPLTKLASPNARRLARAASDPGATLVLAYSTVSLVLMVLMMALLAAACGLGLAAGIENPYWRAATWVGLVSFAALTIIGPVKRKRLSLTLSPAGLDYSEFKIGPIAWPDIREVEIRRVMRSTMLAILLRDEQKYFDRGFKRPMYGLRWTRYLVPSSFMINDYMFDVPLGWLQAAIQMRLDHVGDTQPTHTPTVVRQGSFV